MRASQVRAGAGAARHGILVRRVRLLVAATIAYNVVEACIAIGAETVASSTALIGFGLDSVIEVSSVAAVTWQFAGRDPQARERTALRLIAVAFLPWPPSSPSVRSCRCPVPVSRSTHLSASFWPR